MNQTKNQLYKTNEELIQTTFLSLLKEKEISQITIREICDIAKVNRSTFYRHYEDIYALMSSIEEIIFTEFIKDFAVEDFAAKDASSTASECISEHYISEAHLVRMICHIHKHATFYHAYLKINSEKLIDSAPANLWDKYFVSMFQSYGVTNERHMHYYFQFFKAGLIQCIKQWLEDGCPESPEELGAILWNYTFR